MHRSEFWWNTDRFVRQYTSGKEPQPVTNLSNVNTDNFGPDLLPGYTTLQVFNTNGYFPNILMFVETFAMGNVTLQPHVNHRMFDLGSTSDVTKDNKYSLQDWLMTTDSNNNRLQGTRMQVVAYELVVAETNGANLLESHGLIRSGEHLASGKYDKHSASSLRGRTFDRLLSRFDLRREDMGSNEVSVQDVALFVHHMQTYQLFTKDDIYKFARKYDLLPLLHFDESGDVINPGDLTVQAVRKALMYTIQHVTPFRLAIVEGQHRLLTSAFLLQLEKCEIRTGSAVRDAHKFQVIGYRNNDFSKDKVKTLCQMSRALFETQTTYIHEDVRETILGVVDKTIPLNLTIDFELLRCDKEYANGISKYYQRAQQHHHCIIGTIAKSTWEELSNEYKNSYNRSDTNMIEAWKNGAQLTSPFSCTLKTWDSKSKLKKMFPYHMTLLWHIVVSSTMIEGCIRSLQNNLDNNYPPRYPQIERQELPFPDLGASAVSPNHPEPKDYPVVTAKVPWNNAVFVGNIFGKAHLHVAKAIHGKYKALFPGVTGRKTFQCVEMIIDGLVMLDFMQTFEYYGVSPNTRQAHKNVKNWNNEE